jgi:SAM-dependent methyltransferase
MPSREIATTKEWRALARIDPLYAVASHPGKRGSWREDDFYRTGAQDWAVYRPRWESFAGPLRGSCIEIGCGAGRMTRQLADTFDAVVAVDVATEMLELARAACPPNATFHLVDGIEIPTDDASADAAFSCFVLEHLTHESQVAAYLGEARRVLRPGGSVMIQLALSRERRLERARTGVRAVMMVGLRRLHRIGRGPIRFSGREYGRVRARRLFESAGFRDVELQEFVLPSSGGLVSFWLARV